MQKGQIQGVNVTQGCVAGIETKVEDVRPYLFYPLSHLLDMFQRGLLHGFRFQLHHLRSTCSGILFARPPFVLFRGSSVSANMCLCIFFGGRVEFVGLKGGFSCCAFRHMASVPLQNAGSNAVDG